MIKYAKYVFFAGAIVTGFAFAAGVYVGRKATLAERRKVTESDGG